MKVSGRLCRVRLDRMYECQRNGRWTTVCIGTNLETGRELKDFTAARLRYPATPRTVDSTRKPDVQSLVTT